jgi:16S rRNA (cytidine1402-2'-O)-methyltransferase
MTKTGSLTLVPTPIGNLEDLTYRAVNVLKTADVIACEDTRRTRQLLAHYKIKPPRLLAHHQGNEHSSVPGLLKLLGSGQHLVYVSDSGMPTIADPGFLLTQAAVAAGIPVQALPGASAVTTALAGAGLPTARFTFLGFLPRKRGEQERLLQRFKETPEALVLYESPQRLLKTLDVAAATLGPRNACLCRELTKLHQEYLRAPLPELQEQLAARGGIKGECVLIIAGAI